MRYRLSRQRQYRQLRPRWVGSFPRARISLLGIPRAPIAGRLRLYQTNVVAPDIVATLFDADHTTAIATLGTSRSRSWYDPMNEPGNGSLILQNDDVDLPLVAFKDLIDFAYRGQNAATMIVESIQRNQIDQSEEAGQFTTLSGRLHVASLERAILYPILGAGYNIPDPETERQFNWTSVNYDDSGWANATLMTDVGTAQASWWTIQWPADFPDPSAQIIWASSGTTVDAPVGRVWTRQRDDFSAFGAGWYRYYLTTDNIGQLHVNGFNLVTTEFADLNDGITRANDIFLPGGITVTSVFGENGGDATGNNPAGIAWACYLLSGQGGVPVALVTHSSTNSRIVEYQNDPPGITVGDALLQAIAEMQARGILTGMTVTFTPGADSYGEPWPLIPGVTTAVGNDMLAFVMELAAAGYIDFWMTPAMFEFNAVLGGTRGT